ncbi:MAG: Druantia anti-phage system protein DruA, partial [Deltaproteobacteria bacterium]
HHWIVGSYLKYLAYLDDQLVACLGWGSAAWKVACRDSLIGWSTPLRKKNLSKVANNVRFLVLPWVKVEHLASKVLAANVKRLAADWHSLYQESIVLLETFVDISRFRGTCYRAANWRYVGDTKGIAKSGNVHCYHGQPKAVYLYPLGSDFRERLHA